MLPILKASACVNTDKEWQAAGKIELDQRCMDPIILRSTPFVQLTINIALRTSRNARDVAFWHLLSMDGLEIAASTMCYRLPFLRMPKR